jgi:DNA-binding NarL/FixJ family response regulator
MHRDVHTVSQRRRLLVADDQRPIRRGLYALLSLLPDIEWVGEAEDGCEAVNLVAERRPDVVLMDARMPVMDGIEATQRIKSQQPEVKVIVLTMYAEYQAEALAAGADEFLVKGGPTEILHRAICSA